MSEVELRQLDLDFVKGLSRLEGKVDAIHKRLDAVDDLERRVSRLERAKIYGSGWFAGAVAIGGIMAWGLSAVVKKFFGI